MTNTNPRPNRYAGPCNTCGRPVPAMCGILIGRMVGGNRKWLVRHDGPCPTVTRTREDHPCMVHGPSDDECLGDRCITGRTTRRPAMCPRHGNPIANGTGCWECRMEADIAHRDAHEYDHIAP